jgi:hypothetical protein
MLALLQNKPKKCIDMVAQESLILIGKKPEV